jgi:hypothetical protein
LKVAEQSKELDCDPIEALATVAKQAQANNDLTLAASIYKELAGYCAAKLRPVEDINMAEPEGIRVTIVDA